MDMIEQLLIVQEHDIRIREIKKEMQDIPARKKQETERLTKHKKALADSMEILKSKEVELKSMDGEIEALREKISKLRQQQIEIKTNKEFKAMDAEIKGVDKQIIAVEENELLLMEDIEQARRDVEEKRGENTAEELQVQSDIKALDQRVDRIEGEVKTLQSEREVAADKVDPNWRKHYDRIFKRKDKALVAVIAGICSGCHMSLPPALVHDAKKRSDIVSCGQCGRMLY